MDLTNKVCLVFGGCGGIGTALCQLLHQKGAKVCVGDIQLRDVPSMSYVNLCLKCDVTSDSDVQEFLTTVHDQFGSIDVVVTASGTIHEFDWQTALNVNLGGVIRVTTEALKHMSKSKGGNGGVIVHIASAAGLHPFANSPVYGATKAGVIQYVRAWGSDTHFGEYGVRFGAVCPMVVDTNMLKLVTPESVHNAHVVLQHFSESNILSPSAVAEAMVDLIEGDYTNGAVMEFKYSGFGLVDFGGPANVLDNK